MIKIPTFSAFTLICLLGLFQGAFFFPSVCSVELDMKFLNVWRDLEPQTHPDYLMVTQNKLVHLIKAHSFFCACGTCSNMKNIAVWSAKKNLKQMYLKSEVQ